MNIIVTACTGQEPTSLAAFDAALLIRICIPKSNFREQPLTLRLCRFRGDAQGERAKSEKWEPTVRAEHSESAVEAGTRELPHELQLGIISRHARYQSSRI